MANLKNVWLTSQNNNYDLFSITFESNNTEKDYKILVSDFLFPDNPTEKHRLRHANIGIFSLEELEFIRDKINETIDTVTEMKL